MKLGDRSACPERSACGEAAAVNVEDPEAGGEEGWTGGVRPECYACEYSECE